MGGTERRGSGDPDVVQDPAFSAKSGPVTTCRADWMFLGGALALALLLRVVPLTYSHFWDETVYLQHAMILVDGRANYNEFEYRPPLLPFMYAVGFFAWNHIYAANVVQGLVTMLAVFFGFLLVREAFGRIPAWCTAALLTLMPFLVNASHDLLTDAPALTLMLASMWAFEKPGTRFLLLSGALCALAIQTRFTSMFLLVYFLLQAIVVHKKVAQLGWWAAAAAAATAPYLIWARWTFGNFFHPFVRGRQMVTEWTSPVPPAFYWDALGTVFPSSIWPLAALGLLVPFMRTFAARPATGIGPPVATDVAPADAFRREAVLLAWGFAFLAYMLSIRHKEVRYLLPLVIPVAILAGVGLAEITRWIARQSPAVRAAGVLLLASGAVIQYGSPLQKLAEPWADPSRVEPWVGRSTWEAMQIGSYLKRVSTPADTVYAVHNFPVLAFYSERKTVSLLPIQEHFEQAWRNVMREPGYFVAYEPAGIIETHAKNPEFKPDRTFLDAHPEFRAVQTFANVTVYRYEPVP